MRGIQKGWIVLAGLLTACDTSTVPHVPDLRVSDVTLEARGDTVELEALSDGVVAMARWESLDPSVVTVTEAGLATAVSEGVARVRASFGGAADTGTVTVLSPVDVRVSDLAVVTDPSGEQGMRMRIRNAGGRGFFQLEFWKHDPDGSKRRIVWYATETEAEPGLDVEHRNYLGDELAEWVVAYSREPMAEEPVRTSCARLDGEAAPCPSDLPDPPAAVDSVGVSPAAAVLDVGDTVRFVARAYADGVELTGRPVVWSTPSPDVISLSETGVAVALRPGYGQVNATVEGITSAVGLTVASESPGEPQDPVAWVHVAPRSLRLWVGQRWGFQPSAYDSAGRVLDDRTFSWATEDSAVATIDSAGSVTAAGHGRTRVVATSEDVDGYAVLESYARPNGAAVFAFSGLLSALEDPSTVEPSVDTTWVDGAGVAHDAWIQVRPGSLTMEWSGEEGQYSQRLVLSTYVYDVGTGVRKVAEDVYVDEGTLERWWDYAYGREYFDFTSVTTQGLTYRATWTHPGELAVEQRVGSIAKRSYYFRLEL